MMAAEWHYSKDGRQHGPISASDLKTLAKSGDLLPTDLIRKEGMTEWKPARNLKGLFPVAHSVAVPAIPTSNEKSPSQKSISPESRSNSRDEQRSWITPKRTAVSIGMAFSALMFLLFNFTNRKSFPTTHADHEIAQKTPAMVSPDSLTEEFFPMTGAERFFLVRRYTPKKYSEEQTPLTVKTEEMTSKWLELHPSDKRLVGDGAMYYVMFDKRNSRRTLPGHGTALTYRHTSNGIVRCDSFGTAGGQKALNYEVLELKWGAKPGDSWKTEVKDKNCVFSAQYDGLQTLGGMSCAVLTISRSDNERIGSRKRYWLAKGIGMVRYAEYGLHGSLWRPQTERIYSELNQELEPLDWEPEM